jgi:FKBP-type peptidyl-prolyl cis-trans isomerase 2
MRQATTGDTVHVHYTGTLDDGSVFDSSADRAPLEVTIGSGQVIPGFEEALMGMTEGATKSVTLEPENAYGPHNPQMIHSVERARMPDEITLEIGIALQAEDGDGNQIQFTVIELDDENVTLDANHPLAGKALTFQVEIVGFAGQGGAPDAIPG